jgi:hypothetical protein
MCSSGSYDSLLNGLDKTAKPLLLCELTAGQLGFALQNWQCLPGVSGASGSSAFSTAVFASIANASSSPMLTTHWLMWLRLG